MSDTVEGKQVLFGITDAVKTTATSQVGGIVQSATVTKSANETEIQDEDGDHVAIIYHGAKNEISLELITTETPLVLPEIGAEIDFGSVDSIDGVSVGTGNGRAFITSSSSSQSGAETTSVSLTIAHYPAMLADGT
jgi:hypothetical protein